MRSFFRSHWKVIVAIILLILLALVTVNPGAATFEPPPALRLRAHAAALDGAGQRADARERRADAAGYIAGVLRAEGYRVRDADGRRKHDKHGTHDIEVALSNLAPGEKPRRSFVVGARVDALGDSGDAAAIRAFMRDDGAAGDAAGDDADDPAAAALAGRPMPGARDDAGGAAAVLELARLLKDLRPSRGTEVRFVFFLDPRPDPGAIPAGPAPARHGGMPAQQAAGAIAGGSFIAYAGTQASARRVQDALSAFQGGAGMPSRGLAAPAYLQGVTLSGRASPGGNGADAPVMMITDTGFTRYPYHQLGGGAQGGDGDGPGDAAGDGTGYDARDPRDYEGMARVVSGLARTIAALAAGQRG